MAKNENEEQVVVEGETKNDTPNEVSLGTIQILFYVLCPFF